MTIAEVPEFIQRCRSDCLRHARNTSGFTRAVVLRVNKQLLVIFLDGKNEPGMFESWSVSFRLGWQEHSHKPHSLYVSVVNKPDN
jgi:hypothetical protein